METLDLVMLILRLWIGLVMVMHGINHGRSLDGTARWLASKGFGSEQINARLSALSEIGLGALLIAGFLTAFAAAGVAATMLVAFWSVHRFSGFFNFKRPDEGYEYVATVAVVALVLAIAGPGSASVDAAIGWSDVLDGWVGVAIYAGGLAAGVGQLAMFWHRPAQSGQM
ncbi:MAG: DoxX family protein [Acidimicrobiia bacterium]